VAIATKPAGQKIACLVELVRFSLEPQFSRLTAASRREEGATMINMNAFGVHPAGSHHAAHAAVSATSHKRIAAAATERPWIEALPR
jgi:hypothetical protein